MFKKAFIALTVLLLSLTQISLTVSAENNTVNRQVINVDGQALEIQEVISGKSDIHTYHFDWEDGNKEELQIKSLKDGRMEAKAIGRDGKEYHMKHDLEGNVYLDGKLMTVTVPESEVPNNIASIGENKIESDTVPFSHHDPGAGGGGGVITTLNIQVFMISGQMFLQ